MRTLRYWAPALLAAAAWLASGGLELLGRQRLGGPVRHVLALVAPETVPVQELTAPAPWGLAMPVLSAVAVAAAFAALLGLVRRQPDVLPGERTTAFAAYWFCAVAAGSLVAAVPVAAELVVALQRRATPASFASEHLLTVAHWGLVWGWLPALLAVVLQGRRGDDERGRRAVRRGATAVPGAALFVLAAVGLVLAAPHADAARRAAIPAAAEQPEQPEPPTGEPVAPVAPGEWQADPLWCTSGQLQLTAGPVEPALGSRLMRVTATNVSGASCILESYPDVAFSDRATNALEVGVDHGGSEDPGVSRVVVPAGGQALTTLSWGAMSTAGAEPAGWLHIAAYHGAERQMVRVETDITGGRVAVAAWSAPAL